MTDAQIWSRLPRELIETIILNTDHLHTLYNWRQTCKEVRGLVNRHPALMYTLREARLRGRHQSDGVARKRQRFTSNSASYTVLRLDFQFGRSPYKTGADLVASSRVMEMLSVLLSSMRQIRQLYHKGVLYQDFLGPITGCDTLKRVVLREGHVRNRGQCGQCYHNAAVIHPAMPPRLPSDLLLDFGPLEKLARLQVLNVFSLLPGEGRGLGKAVQSLQNLEELHISAARRDHIFHRFHATSPWVSPIDDFMEATFSLRSKGDAEIHGTSGLPNRLRSLILTDKYSVTTNLSSSFFKERVTPSTNLRSLQINMPCLHWTPHVTLSDVIPVFISARTEQLYIHLPEDLELPVFLAKSKATALVEAMRPFSPTIKHWNLPALSSRALHTEHPEFEQLWAGEEFYCQLRLKHPTSRPYPTCLGKYIWGEHAALGEASLGDQDNSGRRSWGRAVRHIEISNVELPTLTIDCIHAVDDSFDDLRVLVIVPSQPASEPRRYRKAPEDTSKGNLAQQILLQCLPSLRVVVIGAHRFWFQYSSEHLGGPRKLWYLKDAMEDQKQSQEMECILDKVDSLFFDPPYGTRQDKMIGNMSIKRK